MWIVSERVGIADLRLETRVVHRPSGPLRHDFQRLSCSDGPDDGIHVPGHKRRVRHDHSLARGERWCTDCFPEKAKDA